MKTTELVKQLTGLIAKYGDLDVQKFAYDEIEDIGDVQVHTDVLTEKPDFFLVW